MSISDPLPNGTFVRHKKTGKTGTIINNRQNPYYCTPEYRIKLTNKSGRYMQSMWAVRFVEPITEQEIIQQEQKPPAQEPEKESFRNTDPLINPFRSGLFFSAKFWMTPEPKKKD